MIYLHDEIGRAEGAITNGVATAMMNYDDWGKWTSAANNPSTLRFGFKRA